jgi:hypothetical protein
MSIYRFKFSQEFMPSLIEFSRVHQFDQSPEFKDAFKTFCDENTDIIEKEKQILNDNGYKGEIIDKMYKSARYYFKNKDYTPQETKTRRKYIKQDKEFINNIDEIVIMSLRNNEKPAISYRNFMDNDEFSAILNAEKLRLGEHLGKDDVDSKIKKTFKNRFFIQKKHSKVPLPAP